MGIGNDFSRCLALMFAPVKELVGCVDQRVNGGVRGRQIEEGDLSDHQFIRHGEFGIMHQQDGEDVSG